MRSTDPRTLTGYLLGPVELDTWLALQRRLVAEVIAAPACGQVILCEHEPSISVGREGSRSHIADDVDDPIRWVSRGGGCIRHTTGQLTAYPIVSLSALKLNLRDYLEALHDTILATLRAFDVIGQRRAGRAGVWVGGRPIAVIGVGVRSGISTFGVVLNVQTELEPFTSVLCLGPGELAMTSLQRERRLRTSLPMVRQRFIECLAERLGFTRFCIHHSHPALTDRTISHALINRTA